MSPFVLRSLSHLLILTGSVRFPTHILVDDLLNDADRIHFFPHFSSLASEGGNTPLFERFFRQSGLLAKSPYSLCELPARSSTTSFPSPPLPSMKILWIYAFPLAREEEGEELARRASPRQWALLLPSLSSASLIQLFPSPDQLKQCASAVEGDGGRSSLQVEIVKYKRNC